MKTLIIKVSLVFISILIGLILSEVLLRYLYVIPSPLANYYPFAPAKSGSTIKVDQFEFKIDYRFNEQGFRDKEINQIKAIQEKRLLFLGDSTTEGFGNQIEQRYSSLLINSLGTSFNGVNIAQLATNPDNYFDNLITFGVALHPDLVVMGITISNDFMGGRAYKIPEVYNIISDIDNKFEKTGTSYKEFVQLRYIRELIKQVLNKKQLLSKRHVRGNFWDLYFGEKITKKFYLKSLDIDEATFDTIISSFNSEIVPYYLQGKIIPTLLLEGVKAQLSRFKADDYYYNDADYDNTLWYIKESYKLLKDRNIPLVVLVIPDVNQVRHDEFQRVLKEDFKMNTPPTRLNQLEEIRIRLNKDLIKENIIYVDITEKLKTQKDNAYHLYDQHLAPKGHKIAAEELKIIINKLIKPNQ
jgi:lysophospholipase L1-like esterase